MLVSLSMYFDDDEYAGNYPELTQDELVAMFKEDFLDTIRKQWSDQEILDALEVGNE